MSVPMKTLSDGAISRENFLHLEQMFTVRTKKGWRLPAWVKSLRPEFDPVDTLTTLKDEKDVQIKNAPPPPYSGARNPRDRRTQSGAIRGAEKPDRC